MHPSLLKAGPDGQIRVGHKIIVSGLGKNVPICEKFVGSMISMGLDAYFLHTNSAIHGDMGLVKAGPDGQIPLSPRFWSAV